MNKYIKYDVPFMDQMGYTLLLTMVVIGLVSFFQHKGADDKKGIEITKDQTIYAITTSENLYSRKSNSNDCCNSNVYITLEHVC